MKKAFIKKITDSVRKSYSQFAKEFDRTRKQQWPEFDNFLAYTKRGAKVLDLGCGNGRFSEFLSQKEVDYLGMDHNPDFLELAQENYPEADFQIGDMTDLKLRPSHFDNIFCIASFHHVPTKKMRKKVINDLHESLKKDGVLIMTNWTLFQPRYLAAFLKSVLKGAWNDVFIKWADYPVKRYYHAFLPGELRRLFDDKNWKIEEFYFTRKGKRVSFLRSFNLVMIARKK